MSLDQVEILVWLDQLGAQEILEFKDHQVVQVLLGTRALLDLLVLEVISLFLVR